MNEEHTLEALEKQAAVVVVPENLRTIPEHIRIWDLYRDIMIKGLEFCRGLGANQLPPPVQREAVLPSGQDFQSFIGRAAKILPSLSESAEENGTPGRILYHLPRLTALGEGTPVIYSAHVYRHEDSRLEFVVSTYMGKESASILDVLDVAHDRHPYEGSLTRVPDMAEIQKRLELDKDLIPSSMMLGAVNVALIYCHVLKMDHMRKHEMRPGQ